MNEVVEIDSTPFIEPVLPRPRVRDHIRVDLLIQLTEESEELRQFEAQDSCSSGHIRFAQVSVCTVLSGKQENV
jgi:hypothetical protein